MQENKLFTPEFIPLYLREEKEYNLSPSQSKIYGFIRFYIASGQKFYFQDKQLAEILGVAEGTIANSLKELEEKDLIKRETKINKNSGSIRYVWLPEIRNSGFTKSGTPASQNQEAKKEYKYNIKILSEKIQKGDYPLKEIKDLEEAILILKGNSKTQTIDLDQAQLGIFGKVIAKYIVGNPYFLDKSDINEDFIDKNVKVILDLGDRFEKLGRHPVTGDIADNKVNLIITELEKLFLWYTENNRPIKSLQLVLRNWFSKVFSRDY